MDAVGETDIAVCEDATVGEERVVGHGVGVDCGGAGGVDLEFLSARVGDIQGL